MISPRRRRGRDVYFRKSRLGRKNRCSPRQAPESASTGWGFGGQIPPAPRPISSAAMRVERINKISRTVGIVVQAQTFSRVSDSLLGDNISMTRVGSVSARWPPLGTSQLTARSGTRMFASDLTRGMMPGSTTTIAACPRQVSSKQARQCSMHNPVRNTRRRYGTRFAVDEFELLSTAVAGPIEKFLDGHSRGSKLGQCCHR